MKKILAIICMVSLSMTVLSGCIKNYPQKPTPKPPQEEQKQLNWSNVEDGISYAEVTEKISTDDEKNIMLVKIDPKKFDFNIFINTDQKTAKSIQEVHTEKKSHLTFNGGFFTEEFKPTGLLIDKGTIIRKTSNAELLNGIFTIRKSKEVKLYTSTAQLNESKIDFAIQNGPVLIDENGSVQIASDTGKLASRTAIGIDKDGDIILIVLKLSLLNPDNTISLYEFAQLLKNSDTLRPLFLHSVLNLDGGPSTGMMINETYYPEMDRVQNIIYLTKTQQ